jgi:hypothetical protein
MFPRLYDVIIPTVGLMALVVVGGQFWRTADNFHRFMLAPVVMGLPVIALSYYNFRKAVSHLEERVDEKIVSTLFQAGNSMALFAFLICEFAMIYGGHH